MITDNSTPPHSATSRPRPTVLGAIDQRPTPQDDPPAVLDPSSSLPAAGGGGGGGGGNSFTTSSSSRRAKARAQKQSPRRSGSSRSRSSGGAQRWCSRYRRCRWKSTVSWGWWPTIGSRRVTAPPRSAGDQNRLPSPLQLHRNVTTTSNKWKIGDYRRLERSVR